MRTSVVRRMVNIVSMVKLTVFAWLNVILEVEEQSERILGIKIFGNLINSMS